MVSTNAQNRTGVARPASAGKAAAIGVAAVAGATGLLLASSAAQMPMPYPGALLVLAAILAAYFAGTTGGTFATLASLVLLGVPGGPVFGSLQGGIDAVAVVTTVQLVATLLVGTIQERLQRLMQASVEMDRAVRESEALFRAQQTLRLVVDNIPQRVFWKDRDGRYLGCNDAFARDALAASPRQVEGRTDDDMPWTADAAAYRADDAMVISGNGARIGYEERQHRPDGSVAWLRTSKVPMLDGSGAVVGVLGTYEDITAHRRREEQLRIASNAQEFALEAVVTLDLAHRIVSVNRAFTTITGYSPDFAVGRDQAFMRSDRHPAGFYEQIWETATRTGRWHGELWRRHRDGFDILVQASVSQVRDDTGAPTHHVVVFQDISRAREDAEKAAWLAYHDPLTGLSNRYAFSDALQRAMARAERDHSCVAVLYIDMDGFKPVNDSLGHAAGDELLRQVGARLEGAVRRTDRVARIGGDEFAVLLEGVDGASESSAIADAILAELSRRYIVSGHELFLAASIGISLGGHAPAGDADALLRNADIAMYEAKRTGRGRYEFYSHDLDEVSRRALALTSRLHQALERGELALAYQPKVSLRDGRVMAFEALLRWHSDELGAVSPVEFIPVAESTGLIDEIGEWVMRRACEQAVAWRGGKDATAICVNVSTRQLRSACFMERLERVLRETDVPAAALELEITESVVIAEPAEVIDRLQRIRALGVGLVLDDFGTGYSSLSYLKELPVNCLKIDRSFITDLPVDAGDANLVRGILGLARTLGIGVIAEGVETAEQVAFLRGAGCEAAQGYFFAPPLPAAAAGAMLDRTWELGEFPAGT